MKIKNNTDFSDEYLCSNKGFLMCASMLRHWIEKNGYHKDAALKARLTWDEYVTVFLDPDLETFIVEKDSQT